MWKVTYRLQIVKERKEDPFEGKNDGNNDEEKMTKRKKKERKRKKRMRLLLRRIQKRITWQ